MVNDNYAVRKERDTYSDRERKKKDRYGRSSYPVDPARGTYSDRQRAERRYEEQREVDRVRQRGQDIRREDAYARRDEQVERNIGLREHMAERQMMREDFRETGAAADRMRRLTVGERTGAPRGVSLSGIVVSGRSQIRRNMARLSRAYSKIKNDPFKNMNIESKFDHSFGHGAMTIKMPDMKIPSHYNQSFNSFSPKMPNLKMPNMKMSVPGGGSSYSKDKRRQRFANKKKNKNMRNGYKRKRKR